MSSTAYLYKGNSDIKFHSNRFKSPGRQILTKKHAKL